MSFSDENETYLRRLALEEQARGRARGIQGRTRVRAAGVLGSEARCFHITEATFLDEDNPSDDWSRQTFLEARLFDHDAGLGGERKIALKFPRPIAAQGVLFIGCTAASKCLVYDWNPNAYGYNVRLDCFAYGWPILDFNGLTAATLNWSNRGALTLGANIGAPQIAHAFADSVSGYPALLASGIANNSLTPQPNDCALRYYCGAGVTLAGLLLDLQLEWQNLYYGAYGFMLGDLLIDRNDSESAWTFFCFYNPV